MDSSAASALEKDAEMNYYAPGISPEAREEQATTSSSKTIGISAELSLPQAALVEANGSTIAIEGLFATTATSTEMTFFEQPEQQQLEDASTSATSAAPSTQSNALCAAAGAYVLDGSAIVARCLQILFSLLTFVLLCRLIMAKWRAKGAKVFHGNFTILFESMLLVCLLYCFGALFLQLRYLVLYFSHASTCDLLTPLWYAVVARVPGYLHLLALPLLHFAIMCERVRATLFSRFYEREGPFSSIVELAIIWFISVAFSAFVVASVFKELNWEMILIYASLVSKYNAALVIVLQYILLVLVIVTVVFDFWVVLQNRRQQKRKFEQHSLRYNLSQKYQVNENALSMRLMLPLDLSFAGIFLAYLLVATVVRILGYHNALSMVTFEAVYDWLYCLNMQHGIVSIWLYTRFLERAKRTKKRNTVEVRPVSLNGEADAHFRQLKAQWA